MLDIMRQHASGWVIKVLFGIIIIVFIFFFGAGTLRESKGPIIAYVDENPILVRDFTHAYQNSIENLRHQNQSHPPENLQSPLYKQQILSQMINSCLLFNAAADLGLTISNNELQKIISCRKEFQNEAGIFDNTIYCQTLAQNQVTPAKFEQNLRDNLLVKKLRDYISMPAKVDESQAKDMFIWAREQARVEYLLFPQNDFIAHAQVNEKQIAEFYEQNKDKLQRPAQAAFRYLIFTPKALNQYKNISEVDIRAAYDSNQTAYTRPEEIHARHILLTVDQAGGPAEAKKAEASIHALYAKIKTGYDFAELARRHSQDTSAKNGGDLGWFGRGIMVKKIEDAAFALNKGEISEPLRSELGWHLIQVIDHRKSEAMTFEETKDKIRDQIAEERASEKISDLLDKALDQITAGVDIGKIAEQAGLPLTVSSLLTQDKLVQTFAMTPEAAQALFLLNLGSSTKTPLAIEDGYLLAEKIQDIPEATLSLSEAQSNIIQELKRQEARRLADEKAAQVLADLRTTRISSTGIRGLRLSEPFNRFSLTADLNGSPDLAQAIFSAKGNEWLPQTFNLPSSVAIVRLKERISPTEDIWNKEKIFWITTMEELYGDELLQAYLNDLRNKSKIEIIRADLLN